MTSENMSKLEKAIISTLPGDRNPTEAEILTAAEMFRKVLPVSDEEFSILIRRLHAKQEITMDVGVAIQEEDHKSWLFAKKPEIDPYYWDRYNKHLLREGWMPQVVNTLDRVTDDILDLLGNPYQEGIWCRRGLVMGDVQSGKTATYTALCCKAADAGYRFIILLTGTLENLRRQTQGRLDAGFVGRDSSGLLSQQRQTREVGVGTIDRRRMAGVFTSCKKDFSSQLVNQLGLRLSVIQEPVLVVVKKDRRILENLENWLRSYNTDGHGRIDIPMLMIDDEADNASVNTNSPDNDPTRINERIRGLLKLFTRRSYVGFTATPFANIFIDPETADDMVGDDLFPRDFIYSLEAPTNYMGAARIFGDEARYASCLRNIEDAEDYFPTPHKSDLTVSGLPSSLHEAMLVFIVANAIRDLRGEGPSHRSMLVNVSRFTNVQDQVAKLLDERLRQIQQDIRNYSQLDPTQACLNPSIASLRGVWEKEYSTEFEWRQIQNALPKAALPISVKSVNKNTGAASLDYAAHKETGLRVIAVGGNSLSRGLTLEGLCTSYFYRNSQMYDTLMQMGRWFGYRDGYEDLCRIWMTTDAVQWYAHIARAAQELRDEIRKMRSLSLTPRDFGLKVRAHPDSLIVTARNKMRMAKSLERLISISGEGLETPRLYSSPDAIKANALAAENFIRGIQDAGINHEESDWKNTLWRGVPKTQVVSLLRQFAVHPLNADFQGDSIADFLEKTDENSLQRWDVVIPNGSETEDSFAGIVRYKPQRRKVARSKRDKSLLVSGASARVGSRGIEREGIPVSKVQEVDNKYRAEGKSTPDKAYRMVRERPLLLLHIINPEANGKPLDTGGNKLVALGLSFPSFVDDPTESRRVKYKINMVEWKNLFENEIDDELEAEDDTI